MLVSSGVIPGFVGSDLWCRCLFSAADKLVKVWSVLTGMIIRTFEGHDEGLNDVAWSGDSVFVASASDDKTIRIWNVDAVRLPFGC